MSENRNSTRQTQYLLTNLVILTILILALIFLVYAYPVLLAPEPRPTSTPTFLPRPSLTPSLTLTPTSTPTLTNTPRPSLTPTSTLTPTPSLSPTTTGTPPGPPTLTPARPVPIQNAYTLKTWTPADADRLIELLNDYPNSLPERSRGEDGRGYYDAFRYAVFTQREALLRFPDAPEVSLWRWGLAYNLARISDPQAAEVYAEQITAGLNRGETTVDGLPGWFSDQEPRLRLDSIPLEPISGFENSRLLQISSATGIANGSAFLWLLAGPGAYQVQPLTSEFDFLAQRRGASLVSDLTGDGVDDVALYTFRYPTVVTTTLGVNSQPFYIATPRVFDLSQSPANELFFLPGQDLFDIGMEFNNYWAASLQPSGLNDLVFQTDVFPACPVTVRLAYRWNGDYFEQVEKSFAISPNLETLAFCRLAVDHSEAVWGPQATISLMEALLPDWPPELDENGNPAPRDARDEFRFRLGVNYALAGDFEKARALAQEVIDDPASLESNWVEPAQAFLETYKSPDDLYHACVPLSNCRPANAIRQLVSGLSLADYPSIIEKLWGWGLSLRASGYFDFDDDGEKERWFVVQYRPLEKLELWILAPYKNGVKALLVANIETNAPELEYLDEAYLAEGTPANPPVVFLNKQFAFTFQRAPFTREPFLRPATLRTLYPNRFLEGLEAATEALLSGADPNEIYKDLLILQEFPGLLCAPTWTCDSYYYVLGLAAELAGKEQDAVDAYMRVWWDYVKSPYTLMARLKLYTDIALPTATATPQGFLFTPTLLTTAGTPTRTPTPGSYPAPGATATPSTPYP